MKVSLIPEKCIACGLCQTYSPVFDYDDEEESLGLKIATNLVERLKIAPETLTAVKSCPTKALICEV